MKICQMRVITVVILLMLAGSVCSQNSLGDVGTSDMNEMLSSLLNSSAIQQNQTLNMLKAIWSQLSAKLNARSVGAPDVSQQCMLSLQHISGDFQTLKYYLDASPRIPKGILFGNMLAHGSYGECLLIKGKFCTVSNVAVAGLPLSLGLCVPSTCSADDVQGLLKTLAKYTNDSVISMRHNEVAWNAFHRYTLCSPEPTDYSAGAVVMIFVFAVLGLLCLVGTCVDFYQENALDRLKQLQGYSDVQSKLDGNTPTLEPQVRHSKENSAISLNLVSTDKPDDAKPAASKPPQESAVHPWLSFLLCFSALRNTRAVLDTTVPRGAITSINGIRTLSMTWIILGHVFSFLNLLYNNENYVEFATNNMGAWTFQSILNATVSVDTFFVLSGLLVSYLSLKRYQSSGKLPLLRYYLHRYIRLTPSLLIVMLFTMYIFPLLGSGPFWFSFQSGASMMQYCKSYWWSNLLYINNFYPTDMSHQCLGWVWYLANDMQFYVISPIILYLMYRFKGVAVILVNGFLIAVAMITTAVPTGLNHLPLVTQVNGLQPTADQLNMNLNWVYVKPWTRIGPYAVGLVLGYILITKKQFTGQYRHLLILFGWILATGTALALIYGPYTSKNHVWTNAEQVIYGMTGRTLWGCCIAWVVYACHNGHGGVVNRILSWKAWIPLSRLTYGAYLLHPLVVFYLYGTVQSPMHSTMVQAVYDFMGCTMLSYLCAFILSITVENPVFNIEKLYLKF